MLDLKVKETYLTRLVQEFRQDFEVNPADTWPAQKELWRTAVAAYEITRGWEHDENTSAAQDAVINQIRLIALDSGFKVRQVESTISSARHKVNR
jgi:hypothetical protein